MAYSIDFRRHVLDLRDKEGLTFEQTAHRFGVGVATLVRWSKQLERKPYPLRMYKINLDALYEDVKKYPDSYQYERAARFGVVPSAIHKALKYLGVTYKKNPKPSKSGRRQTAYLPGKN